MNVFFTYIYTPAGKNYDYGSKGNTGWPLTFSNKGARSTAQNLLTEGDLVFGVVSRNPGHGAIVPDAWKGRVLQAWQMTKQNALLTDYDVKVTDWDLQWPYALQPIRTWEIPDAPEFRELEGYDASTHTLQSVSSIERVNETLAASLLNLLKEQAQEVKMAKFKFAAMQQRNEQLRQRHPIRIEGYEVAPIQPNELNYVYIATLGKGSKTLKIGHATDPDERVNSFNKYRLSNEPQWVIHTRQPIGTVQQAVKAEAALGEAFSKFRTEQNNNEIYIGLSAIDVLAKLATIE